VVYALRAEYRYGRKKGVLKHSYNEIISQFVGFCKQRGIKLFISTNARDEASCRITYVINREMDKLGIRAYRLRNEIIMKCVRRLRRLFEAAVVEEVEGPKISNVRRMYLQNRERLREVSRKKGRKALLPSETDIKILGEAAKLAEKSKVIMITEDHDFLDFSDEIENRFRVKVVRISELVSMMQEI